MINHEWEQGALRDIDARLYEQKRLAAQDRATLATLIQEQEEAEQRLCRLRALVDMLPRQITAARVNLIVMRTTAQEGVCAARILALHARLQAAQSQLAALEQLEEAASQERQFVFSTVFQLLAEVDACCRQLLIEREDIQQKAAAAYAREV